MWIKNGIINRDNILHCEDGRTIIGARTDQWLAEGWEEYTIPQTPVEEIQQDPIEELQQLKEELQYITERINQLESQLNE